MSEEKKYWIWAAVFMAAYFFVQLLTAGGYELHRDEMLYFNMGSYPAFGYLTVPPVTGLLAFFVKSIFGWSVFGIKLIPALLGSASLFLVTKTVRDLGGSLFALVIASMAFIFTPGFLLIFGLFTPNAAEFFLWTLAIYLTFRITMTQNPRLWIWLALVIGLSFNTKYSIVLPAFLLIAALLLSKQRHLLFNKWFPAGLVLGFLLILPNLVWQYNHNWPVLFHFEELKRTQLDNLGYLHYFTDLFNLNSAFLIVWLIGLAALLFSRHLKNLRFLGWAILGTIALFFMMKGKAYYTAGLIPFLIGVGAYSTEKFIPARIPAIVILSIITAYAMLSVPYVKPVLSYATIDKYGKTTGSWVAAPFMRWEDGNEYPISQVYADMTGWQELAALAGVAYSRLSDVDKGQCTVFCEHNYGYAGAIHFYGKRYNLPQPVTYHDSYIFWAPDSIPAGPVIYIHYEIGGLKDLFGDVEEIGTVSNPYFREKGVKVFLCRNPRSDLPAIYRTDIQIERERFSRKNQ